MIFDEIAVQQLSTEAGLPSNNVLDVAVDSTGAVWLATPAGLAEYRMRHRNPQTRITDVVAGRRYGPVDRVQLRGEVPLIAFEYSATTPADRPATMVHIHRLIGRDTTWQYSRDTRVEFTNLEPGEYRFEVRSADQDLNYSDPAQIELRIVPDYSKAVMRTTLAACLVGLVVAGGITVFNRRQRNRAQQRLLQSLEAELQTAHDLQMGLMPTESPQIESFDIAGRCFPANHVGGDFFQYFQQDGKLSVCLADVTGHAMEAAIPVVMFNGVLESQMEQGGSLEDLFSRLTRSLYRTRVNRRTYVCFTMGEVNLSTRTLQLANGGCPYPYHFRADTGEVAELPVAAYPLGVYPDTAYSTIEVSLSPGDRLVFCSDGIAEAANVQKEIFGFERTAETIRQACAEDLSAEAIVDRLISTAKSFAGDAPQGDDMTVVVLKVEA